MSDVKVILTGAWLIIPADNTVIKSFPFLHNSFSRTSYYVSASYYTERKRSRSKSRECECCLNWYHVKCGDISDDEYRNISETVWYWRKCIAIREKNKSVQQAKLFLRYVDDIVRTVEGDPEKVLRAANLLHPNLQVTIETPNTNGNLAFLNLQISIDKSRKISSGWYQKPTDTGTILNFRSCALLQYKRSLIEELFTGFSAVSQHGKNMIKL